MAEMLKDKLHTRYITNDFVQDLGNVLSSVTAIDLAKCRFTPNAEQELRKYYATVDMEDSDDPIRDSIVKRNNKAARCPEISSMLLPSDYETPQEVVEILKSIDKTKTYRLVDKDKALPDRVKMLAIEMIMQFPEIKFDLGIYAKNIFETVRREWLPYAKKHDAYWQVMGSAIVKIDCKDGMITDFEGRVIKEETYIQEFVVLPYSFGTENVIKDEEFNAAWMSVLKKLNTVSEREKHMLDYIELA